MTFVESESQRNWGVVRQFQGGREGARGEGAGVPGGQVRLGVWGYPPPPPEKVKGASGP